VKFNDDAPLDVSQVNDQRPVGVVPGDVIIVQAHGGRTVRAVVDPRPRMGRYEAAIQKWESIHGPALAVTRDHHAVPKVRWGLMFRPPLKWRYLP